MLVSVEAATSMVRGRLVDVELVDGGDQGESHVCACGDEVLHAGTSYTGWRQAHI
jgi:hypothetical protein